MNIKISCIILLLSLISRSRQNDPAFVQKLKDSNSQCLQETGVEQAAVDNALNNGVFPDNDEKLGCFFLCVGTNMGHMNADGVSDPSSFGSNTPPWMNPANATQVLQACTGLKGSDPCNLAYVVTKCLKLGTAT